MPEFSENSLVLYKSYPARLRKITDKLEIEMEGGKEKRVRPQDLVLLHSGPFHDLKELTPQTGNIDEAWELLQGEKTTLGELAELVFGKNTPATAWATWQIVSDGLHFTGTAEAIEARPREIVEAELTERATKTATKQAWSDFIERVRDGRLLPEDHKQLSDVEALARGKATTSRVLRDLESTISPESAHALLLRLKYWDLTKNPYPSRYDMPATSPELEIPPLLEEDRLDLTHLQAFAIDDEGNQDPDDALSLEGDVLWVHVADVSALVTPDSPLDLAARELGANLYLPEHTITMLPAGATHVLGLGLQEKSPALSFGIKLGADGLPDGEVDVARTWVRVTRLTYGEVEERIEESPFKELHQAAVRFSEKRAPRCSARIDLPEVKLYVQEGKVIIRPLPKLRSRELVTEAMLMAGEAAAQFALKNQIPFAFTTQAPPDVVEQPKTLAAMFAYRKKLKPSQMKSSADPHSGLGLDAYTRITSPLRRYLDLVCHQQLRSFLKGEPLLTQLQIMARVGSADSMSSNIRRAERLSNQHWTLVYLLQNPHWEGSGILVEKLGQRGTVVLPELGMEARVYLNGEPALNESIGVKVTKVDLPALTAYLQAL